MWNHRVIRTYFPEFEEYGYQVHEVYYGVNGTITGYTEQPVTGYGETLEELRDDLTHQLAATQLPILEKSGKELIEVKP
jgi:hypothetical protein